MDNLVHLWRETKMRGMIALSALALASAAMATDCDADLNGDDAVDGADLGMLLAFWGTSSPASDLNNDGLTDGGDLGILLSEWGPCPFIWDEYSRTIPSVVLQLQTPAGPRTVNGSAQLHYRVGPPDGGGFRPVEIELMSLSLSSTTIFTTETGGISLKQRADAPMGSLSSSGLLSVPLMMDGHYWQCDVLHPPTPSDCMEVGGSNGAVPMEQWNGLLQASVTTSPSAQSISGSLSLTVTSSQTGLITGGSTTMSTVVPKKTYPGLDECPKARKCNKLVICIQPVFIGTGAADATATGKSYATMKAKAEETWARACVEFNWLAPKYVNNNAYKTLKRKAAGDAWEDHRKLLDEEDKKEENDCIEVFFVTHLQTADGKNNDSGDGLTFGSGTKGAKIIIADDATEACVPKSDNVLGHELGHACGNCAHSANGSCMDPTGKTRPDCPGVNTTNATAGQIDEVRGSPVAKEKAPKDPCCKNPST